MQYKVSCHCKGHQRHFVNHSVVGKPISNLIEQLLLKWSFKSSYIQKYWFPCRGLHHPTLGNPQVSGKVQLECISPSVHAISLRLCKRSRHRTLQTKILNHIQWVVIQNGDGVPSLNWNTGDLSNENSPELKLNSIMPFVCVCKDWLVDH